MVKKQIFIVGLTMEEVLLAQEYAIRELKAGYMGHRELLDPEDFVYEPEELFGMVIGKASMIQGFLKKMLDAENSLDKCCESITERLEIM